MDDFISNAESGFAGVDGYGQGFVIKQPNTIKVSLLECERRSSRSVFSQGTFIPFLEFSPPFLMAASTSWSRGLMRALGKNMRLQHNGVGGGAINERHGTPTTIIYGTAFHQIGPTSAKAPAFYCTRNHNNGPSPNGTTTSCGCDCDGGLIISRLSDLN